MQDLLNEKNAAQDSTSLLSEEQDNIQTKNFDNNDSESENKL